MRAYKLNREHLQAQPIRPQAPDRPSLQWCRPPTSHACAHTSRPALATSTRPRPSAVVSSAHVPRMRQRYVCMYSRPAREPPPIFAHEEDAATLIRPHPPKRVSCLRCRPHPGAPAVKGRSQRQHTGRPPRLTRWWGHPHGRLPLPSHTGQAPTRDVPPRISGSRAPRIDRSPWQSRGATIARQPPRGSSSDPFSRHSSLTRDGLDPRARAALSVDLSGCTCARGYGGTQGQHPGRARGGG